MNSTGNPLPTRCTQLIALSAVAWLAIQSAANAQVIQVTAGANHAIDFNQEVDESVIRVWEYPTVPEPGALTLAALAGMALLRRRG